MTFSFVQQTDQWQKFRLRVVSAFPKFHRATALYSDGLLFVSGILSEVTEKISGENGIKVRLSTLFFCFCVFCRSILRTFVQQLEVTWCRIPSPSTTPTMRNEAIKEINHHFVFVEWRKCEEILFRNEIFFGVGAKRIEAKFELNRWKSPRAKCFYILQIRVIELNGNIHTEEVCGFGSRCVCIFMQRFECAWRTRSQFKLSILFPSATNYAFPSE